jgi:multiple sugar transport system ATP-binding protein
VIKLKLDNVNKQLGGARILRDVSLEIAAGEFVVFVGPSGCGKSTLLRLIAGLDSICGGDLLIDGRRVNDLEPRERGVGMVFQSYALYPHMSVYDNISFGLKLAKTEKSSLRERVLKTAQILQLDKLLQRKPKELSGGQRQRVAMGRAMAREPDILLFDEPLSNLDASLRVQMRNEIARLHARLGSTMIYVTHDQVEAMTMADKIVVLRAGVIEQVGTPMELYDQPQSEFVAGFIGSPKMNFLTKSHAEPFQAARIGIRPEHLTPQDDGPWRGRVTHVEHLGSDTFVYLDLGGEGSMTVRLDGRSPVAAGDNLAVGPKGPVYRFSPQGRTIVA